MAKLENKSLFCIDCLYVFDSLKKYHSRDRCNPCYQKLYIKDKLGDKKKEVSTTCSICNAEYGSINEKGRAVIRGPKNCCKKCYSKSKKPKKECENCGNTMLAGSNTGLCVVCRELKRENNTNLKRKYTKKVIPLPFLDVETYEAVRRLLVRFKFGNNGIVDNFRVVDIYMDLYDNPVFLDTLTEEAQIVEMLRYLKKVYDFNKEDRVNKLEVEKKKADFKKKYYKYQKKEKKVNLTADMKAYRKDYYQKNYANGGYIKYLLKREEKN
jgi:hypothetical protein